MISHIKQQLIIACISAVAISLTLMGPYAVANSDILKNDDAQNYMANNDSVFKNYNTVGQVDQASYYSGQSVSLSDLDLSEEDFTGDAAP
ncbi:hypothetical protein BH18THE1_BH18THE1_03520 [soil metagenome]